MAIRLFLAAAWAVSAAGGSGVICYGSDGHVAIEPEAHHHSVAGHCGDVAGHDDSDHPHANCNGRGLPCRDIRLYSSIVSKVRDDTTCAVAKICSLPFDIHDGGRSFNIRVSVIWFDPGAFGPPLGTIVLQI